MWPQLVYRLRAKCQNRVDINNILLSLNCITEFSFYQRTVNIRLKSLISITKYNNAYLISSNSPSGGMKLIECSVSNLDNFTHWWNWQSSITTTGFPDRAGSSLPPLRPFPFASITILSLIPNLHSGIPERYDFMTTFPATCAERTWPKITLKSITSFLQETTIIFALYCNHVMQNHNKHSSTWLSCVVQENTQIIWTILSQTTWKNTPMLC